MSTERYVNCELSPRARDIFTSAAFRSRDCGPWYDYIPVSVVHMCSDCWELGFIPPDDIVKGSTTKGFLYSGASDSLFGPFWFFFLNGRWECFFCD